MKILYMNGIEWKQVAGRHQMMYYEMEKTGRYDCTVIDVHKVLRSHRHSLKRNTLPPKYRIACQFPYQYELAISRWLTALSYRRVMRDMNEYDFIWLGSPEIIRYIPESYTGKILYDCMDNYENFSNKKNRKLKVREKEKECIRRAEIVLATSEWLCDRIRGFDKECSPILVRNAYDGKRIYPVKEALKKSVYQIGFIGAVAGWVDVEIMDWSTQRCPDICYHLVGPYTSQIQGNERLIYEGSKEHDTLYNFVKEYDCLVMPFHINDLTRAVDPVKLYEYIAFGKCIVSCYYEEIERFEPFVYFYHDREEYVDLLNHLAREGFPPKYTREEQERFIRENTWEKRFEIVDGLLEGYL